ncbi:O-methyltransferase-domain-containing protein [Cladochytrium replicatum]|nr:O-methyltransferase-domain-containing protein [Cladochytrium replicatum]
MSLEQPKALSAVMDMVGELWSARCVIGLVNLGVPDLLAKGPATAEELAEKLQLHPGSLFRVLRVATYRGFFAVDPASKKFELTEAGLCLTTDHPTSKFALVKSWATPIHWLPWGHLEHSLKTSEPATKVAFPNGPWQYYAEHPEDGLLFSKAMTEFSAGETEHILKAYPFKEGDAKVVVDVGGAHGALLTAVLDSIPSARGILFDLPEVVEKAADIPRVEKVGGSFLDPVIPTGGDIYILKHILHDWSDEEGAKILKNVRAAMGPESKLLVGEQPISWGPEGKAMATMDVNMMVMFGGKERTLDEYSALFDAADLKISRVVATEVRISIIEVVRK